MNPQQLENEVRNGAFLMLNLGNNTVGLGSSSAAPMPSQSPHPASTAKTRNPNAVINVDSSSSSDDEESEASGSCKNKRASKGTKDPDWVPQKKARKGSNLYCRTVKSNLDPYSSSSNQYMVMPGLSSNNDQSSLSPRPLGSNNPSKNSMRQLNSNIPSETSAGDSSGMPVSGAPPRHLVGLLNFFGWKVVFRPGSNDYVYISPAGLAYCSILKAFETFLNGTSKYKEKAQLSSQSIEYMPLNDNHTQGLASLVSGFVPQSVDGANDIGKKGIGAKRRNPDPSVTENGKARLSSQSIEYMAPYDTITHGLPSSISGFVPQSGGGASNTGKQGIGAKRRNSNPTVTENEKAQLSSQSIEYMAPNINHSQALPGLVSGFVLESGDGANDIGKNGIGERRRDPNLTTENEKGQLSSQSIEYSAPYDILTQRLPSLISGFVPQTGAGASDIGKEGIGAKRRNSNPTATENEKAQISQSIEYTATNDNLTHGLPSSISDSVPQSGAGVSGILKKGRGAKRRNSNPTMRENEEPVRPTEEPLQPRHNRIYESDKQHEPVRATERPLQLRHNLIHENDKQQEPFRPTEGHLQARHNLIHENDKQQESIKLTEGPLQPRHNIIRENDKQQEPIRPTEGPLQQRHNHMHDNDKRQEPARPTEGPIQLRHNLIHANDKQQEPVRPTEGPLPPRHNLIHENDKHQEPVRPREGPLQPRYNLIHENNKPQEPVQPTKEPIQPSHNLIRENGTHLLQMQDKIVAQEVNPVVYSSKQDKRSVFFTKNGSTDNEFKQMTWKRKPVLESSKGCSDETRQDGASHGARRSVLTRRSRLPINSEMNSTRTTDSSLYVPATGVSGETNKDNDEHMLPTSRAEYTVIERPEACGINESLKNGVRNSNSSNVGIRGSEKSTRYHKERNLVGVRRPRRTTNRKNVSVDAKVVSGMAAENRCLPLAEPDASSAARKDITKSLIQVGALEEKHSRINGGHFNSEPKILDSSGNMVLNQPNISNRCSNKSGVRRSMRINGKHVPVDDESDIEMWAYYFNSDFSEPAVYRMAKKENEKITASSFQVGCMEVGVRKSDDVKSGQGNMEISDCQQIKTQRQSETRSFKNNGNMERPGSNKCSSSTLSKYMRAKNPVAHKFSQTSAIKKKTAGTGNSNAENKNKRNGGCGLVVNNRKNDDYEEILAQTKICILSWLIDSGTLTENEKVMCITNNDTSKVSSGLINRDGILCECCDEVFPLFKFEAHTGGNLHRPWDSIFLMSGKTLMQCLCEAWEREKKEKKVGFRTVGTDDPDPSDDTCGVCADGGHLICCDNCPSTFHADCLMIKTFPEGLWCCPYCTCSFCMVAEHESHKTLETSKLFNCKQCGCKYHQECARKRGTHEMGKASFSFCGVNCNEISEQLYAMLGASNPIEGGFSWTLLKRLDEDTEANSNERLSLVMECNAKLSIALTILNECFVPLIDQRTGVDLICQAVYNCGSNFNRLNYEGFYTIVLEKDEEIISAASLRIHGTRLAEMPFVGTRPQYRRQGMCRRLIKAIEDMLSSFYIKKLVIPAISDLLKTWMTSFSFKHLESSHKDEIRNLSMVIFAETTLLQKSICNNGEIGQEGKVASGCVSAIQSQADEVKENNIADHDKERETSHGLPSSYGEHICNGIYAEGSQERGSHECSIEGAKDAALDPYTSKNFMFSPGLLPTTCSFKGHKDSSLGSCQMIGDLGFAPPHLDTCNSSVSETSALNSTLMPSQNLTAQSYTSAPLPFPSFSVPLGDDTERPGVIPPPDNHMNRWLQNIDQIKDIQDGATRGSIAFDNLLRTIS